MMRMELLSALTVLSHELGAFYEPKDDVVVVLYQGEQMFTISSATKKGCPVYNPWVIDAWVFENYFEVIRDMLEEDAV